MSLIQLNKKKAVRDIRKLKFGFNHRYHEAVREAKSIVDSGRLGKIMWIRGAYGKAGGPGYQEDWRSHYEILVHSFVRISFHFVFLET